MRIQIVRGTWIDGEPHAAGAVVEVDNSQALVLFQMGKAKPAPSRPEAAVVEPAETAVDVRARGVRARTSGFVDEVPGIGAEMAAELSALGIETIAQLLAADVATLTQIHGVGKATARKWQRAARELIG